MIGRYRGAFLAALVLVVGVLPLSAQQLRVVATNSWTAALAAAAGAGDVVTLAPTDLRHPAEYELKPSDVAALNGAGLIVSTGFEVMAKKLAEAAGSQRITMLQVGADYSLSTMRKSILAIADAAGTPSRAQASLAALESFMASWKAELKAAGVLGAAVVVHLFQRPLIAELGFDIRGMFGPGPVEAAQIAKLSPLSARFLVDNWHNEVGGPLRETMKTSVYVSLINFPGPDGTKSLLDVLADNRARLRAAAGY